VGTSPKQFAAIVRLRNLIDQYSGVDTLTDVAHKAGYFDQSHFIKDFQSFTGKTPKQFFAAPPQW
jgi:AraC-like DNA-binding protein